MIWRLLLAVVLLVVVVGGIVGFNIFRDRAIQGFFAGQEPPPVTVSVVAAEPTTWRPGVEAIGTASAVRGVELGVEAGGIVQDILFHANDRVEAGDLLVQIDDRMERADVAAAEAELRLSEETLERVQALRERGVAPVSDLDVARADATAARNTVLRLTAVMEQKALKAPFAGIVGIPQIEVGAFVEPGTVYATLQDVDTMRVDFSVPEQQIPLVQIGLPVVASTEVDNTSARGRVVAIEPRIDPNSRLVTIRAELETPEGTINPGQFLRIRVELPEEAGVIALPQTVLSSNLYGDSVFVVRTEGEGDQAVQKVEQVFVTVGRRSQGLVEIAEGVKPGDQVVTAGQNRLSGGARVTVDNSVNPLPAAALD
jgi:membrane fusion protein (multidrug efflux system)